MYPSDISDMLVGGGQAQHWMSAANLIILTKISRTTNRVLFPALLDDQVCAIAKLHRAISRAFPKTVDWRSY